jgi:hypothetical protein
MIRLSRWKLIVLGSLGVTVLGSIGGFMAYKHHQEMTEPSGLNLKFWIETVTKEEELKKVIAECLNRSGFAGGSNS